LFVITGEVNAALTKALPRLLREVRDVIGERRVTIVFDRGGWSPKLFDTIIKDGFDVLTYSPHPSRPRRCLSDPMHARGKWGRFRIPWCIVFEVQPKLRPLMDPLLHKRHGFAAERELRLLKFDEVHFSALVPKHESVPELPEHIYLDWVLSDVIDEIIVSPYADVNFEYLVRRAINATDPNLGDRVALSVLHERRYPPGF
jgi:hypothetical protein